MKQAKLFKTTAFAGVSVAVVPEGVRVAPLEAGEPTVDLQDVPLALDPLTAAAGGVAGADAAEHAAIDYLQGTSAPLPEEVAP